LGAGGLARSAQTWRGARGMSPGPSTAAAIIIGNEVLSAKVQDENGPLIIRRLHEVGVALKWVSVVPDEVDAIVDAVAHARRAARWVVTSGGIGPTHDDVTVRAVSLALGRPVVRMPELVAQVHKHYGPDAPAEALRLADAPQGAQLLQREGIWYPVLSCDGVFMLPGVPQLFRVQLEVVLSRLEGQPVELRVLYLGVGETAIAQVLDRVAAENPEVAIGSYPNFDEAIAHRVKLTIEHPSAEPVHRVLERLRRELPAGAILRES
jgi:molybdenum cofactor synthesis domain-containing protein